MKTRTNTVPNMRYKSDDGAPAKATAGHSNAKPKTASASATTFAEAVEKKAKKVNPGTSKHSAMRKQILVARSAEAGIEIDVKQTTNDAPPNPSDKDKNPNRCKLCSKNFDRVALYKYHMKTRHPNEHARANKAAKPFACKLCDAKFRSSDRLNTHTAQAHAPDSSTSSTPKRQEMSVVQTYFDSIAPNESARIVHDLETMFKHSNRFVSCLRSEGGVDNVANYDQLHRTHRTLMEKQQQLYDAAIGILSAKRDSIKFAFDNWTKQHASEIPAADVEDYSQIDMGIHLELSSDGTIVSEKKSSVANGGGSGGPTKVTLVLKDVECQTNIQGSDLQLSDCLNGDEEFEFLDSKTGEYITNKPTAPDTYCPPEAESGQPVDDDDEMVELIEVGEDFDDTVNDNQPDEVMEYPSYQPTAHSEPALIPVGSRTTTTTTSTAAPAASTNVLSPLPSDIRNALLDVEANTDGLYKCIKCPFTCKARARLIPHYKHTHLGGNASQPCPKCDRLFIDADDLKMHMHVMHRHPQTVVADRQPVRCKLPRCSMVFRTAQEMHAHISTVHFHGVKMRSIKK